jgi:uncharacterized radical SAM superfamily Fe-S cluster-containing enzyme
VPVAEVRRRLERLLAVTGTPVPIQISGGEPTTHPDLPDIIALARDLGYRNIELITNGIRISRRPELLEALRERGLTAVYLQFDGLARSTYLTIRGQDMTEIRHRSIAAARRAGLCVTLAVAVTRGVNDHELGDVVRFAVDNIDTVRAVNFQSATRFRGRFALDDRHGGYSLPGILALIEAQTGIAAATFRSDYFSHPLCNAMSFVFVVDGRLEPLLAHLSADDVRSFLGAGGRDTLLALFAGKEQFFFRHLCNPAAWKLIAKASAIFGYNPLNVLRTRHLLLFAKSFMERDALDAERIDRCCYGITDADGVYSFCAFNNLYRFPDRAETGGQRRLSSAPPAPG